MHPFTSLKISAQLTTQGAHATHPIFLGANVVSFSTFTYIFSLFLVSLRKYFYICAQKAKIDRINF